MTTAWELAAAAGFGLLWGSFLNVVIYRLPQTDAAELGAGKGRTLAFLAWPRSYCPLCEAPIPFWRNIPLLSYLLLLGKAPCCGRRISARYPLGEALGAATIVWPLVHFGPGVDMVLAAMFLSLLLVISGIDMNRRYILNILTTPLMWAGLLVNVDARFALLHDAVLGAAAGYLGLRLMGAFFKPLINFWNSLFSRPARKEVIGAGDPLLLAGLGAWLGWQDLPFLIFLASLLGVMLSTVSHLVRFTFRGRRKRFWNQLLSFGPCLSLAGALMLFYGDELQFAYLDFLAGSR